jgi:Tfp pilus assembly protein PilX
MKKFPTPSLKNSQEQGFVLLFAIVVSAVIFFIGAGIFSIAYKELLVSSLGKDSQKSIFAADSAVECALQAYQDGRFEGFPITTFRCFDHDIIPDLGASVSNYSFRLPFDDGSCARVTVIKETGQITFFGQGYNTCVSSTASPVTSYPGLTERVYKVTLEVPE